MFRSKKKKSAVVGGGGGTRKRKEIDADGSGDEAAAAVANDAVDEKEQTVDVEMRDVDDSTQHATESKERKPEEGGNDEASDEGDDENEDALLARMRDRNAKRGKLKSSMTFYSKTNSNTTKKSSGGVVASQSQSAAFGSLSFEDDEIQKATSSSSKQQSRRKIRPNLLVSNTVMDEETDDSKTSNSYTFDMLDALRKEQKVLLRSALEKEEGEQQVGTTGSDAAADIDMAEVEGATIVLEEVEEEIVVEQNPHGESEDEDEEFIPLHSKIMKSRKKRNRVTFGVHASGPKLSKTTAVDELTDDDDDEEETQRRKWEEELMRRGGHHAPSQSIDSDMFRGAPGSSSKKTYPTRKKVPNGSLADVLVKLQKSFDAATFENDRAERELARIDAEVLLIENNVEKQKQELLTNSEEFEYFQVVEDYVKGLSFCLREKVREIEANEKEIGKIRVENIRSIRTAEAKHAQDIANKLVAIGAIVDADVRGLWIFSADIDAKLPPMNGSLDNEVSEKLKQGFVDRTPAIQQDSTLDVFADTVDDMNSLQHVYGRFQEWRSKFPEVYKNCYCDIALEKLYAPYVRAELLFWDPLSVGKLTTNDGKPWSFTSFEWFQVLRQHISQRQQQSAPETEIAQISVDDGPTAAQIRDVVLAKALSATNLYFDPFSALHTRSICALLEEMTKYDGYTQYCAPSLTSLATEVTAQFASESKLIPLIAIRDKQAPGGSGGAATIYDFASYQLSRFNALLDNLLTFFVALPRDAATGSSQTVGFRCVMQVLHQLLAFLSHCQRVQKTLLVPQAVQTVAQLTSSPYLQQLLASSSQEQELKHILALFAPFVATR